MKKEKTYLISREEIRRQARLAVRQEIRARNETAIIDFVSKEQERIYGRDGVQA